MNTASTVLSIERRKWFRTLGATLLVLGVGAIGVGSALELTSVLILAPLLFVSSIIQFLTAFFAEKGQERFLHFGAAGLEAIFGFVVMANPFHTIAGMILVLAIIWMAIGLARVARSLFAEDHARGWIVMTGVVAILLGIFLFTGQTTPGLWLIALCIGIDFICHGISWSALGWKEPVRS